MRWQDDECGMHDCTNKLAGPDVVFCIEHDRSRFVPCELCGDPTPMLGTVRCDLCWEAERQIERIVSTPMLAKLVIEALEGRGVITHIGGVSYEMCPSIEFDEPAEEQRRNRELVGCATVPIDNPAQCCGLRRGTGQCSRFCRPFDHLVGCAVTLGGTCNCKDGS